MKLPVLLRITKKSDMSEPPISNIMPQSQFVVRLISTLKSIILNNKLFNINGCNLKMPKNALFLG